MKLSRNTKFLPLAALLAGAAALAVREALYAFAVEDRGLLVPGHPLGWVLGALTVLVMVYLIWNVVKGADVTFRLPDMAAAAGTIFCAAAMAVTVAFVSPMTPGYTALAWRLLGCAAAVGMAVQGVGYGAGRKPGFVPDLLVCLFCLFHIIDHYRPWSGNPQMMDSLLALAAMGAMTLFSLYCACDGVGLPRRRLWLGTGLCALFFCAAELLSGYLLLDLGFIAWVLVRLYTPRKGETGNGAA